MDVNERKKSAKLFADNWEDRGYEKGDAQVFWTELLRDVVGTEKVSAKCRFEYRTASGGFIDCLIPDAGVIIEQKGLGVDLDKPEERQGRMVTPFEQALGYAESFPRNLQPRFIVVCNFSTFRVHDRDAYARTELASKYIEFTLEELGQNPHLLGFITDPANSRAEREKKVSMEAGRLIGELHTMLQNQYIDPESEENQKALNILCVRLVFCLFCEDAELFPKDAFLNYLRNVEPQNIRVALKRLFKALDTPIAERDPYDESVKPFPYVNGGLFAEDSEIPNFTDQIKFKLLFEVSQQTDWSQISPTIFGGIFESTLNPETRRSGGMHYTSPENIHKVIDPLFLDGLQEELDSIRSQEGITPRKKKNALRRFRKKLASLKFLDPACGSGNFLTETYLSLRRLEDDALSELNNGQVELVLDDDSEESNERVTLSQFYGIEINDFAANVARTALWIAQLQANNETDMLLDVSAEDFPLRDTANIVEANALRIDWDDVLPSSECSYIMGNPPFVGFKFASKEQKDDLHSLFGKQAKLLDYVCGWYLKATHYMHGFEIEAAFVSTNSVCQGKMAADLWSVLQNEAPIRINFAYRSFVWDSEAADSAHVHCVIVGFSEIERKRKYIFTTGRVRIAQNINCYLLDFRDIYVVSRSSPISNVPKMVMGNQAMDGGNLIIEANELDEFIASEPKAIPYIKRYMMGNEFINNKKRWCLWLAGVDESVIDTMPLVKERVAKVREMRSNSNDTGARKKANTPHLFREQRNPDHFIAIPIVSSQRRKYVPMGYLDDGIIAGNKLFVIENANLYHLGILMSTVHNAWLRAVGARLKSDYTYSKDIVYNNFVWPGTVAHPGVPADEAIPNDIRTQIERYSQTVLDIRNGYPTRSLAYLYDPKKMPTNLEIAHRELDAAVEAAYGVDFNGDEEKIVAHLFKLYAELTNDSN